MAFREVDPGPMPDTGTFHRFNAIGDTAIGRFLSYEQADGTYGKEHRYTFRNREGVFIVTANYDLHRRLQAAKLEPGWAVQMKYVSNLPPKKPGQSPMRVFKVLVDDTPSRLEQPKPQQETAYDDDDMPF